MYVEKVTYPLERIHLMPFTHREKEEGFAMVYGLLELDGNV